MKRPSSSTSAIRSRSSGKRWAYCALTSISGIAATAGVSLGHPWPSANPETPDEIGGGEDDHRGDGVLDEPEILVEAMPALPDRPADPGEAKTPRQAAQKREDG